MAEVTLPKSAADSGHREPGEALHLIASGEDGGVPMLVATLVGGGPPVPLALAGDFAWRLSGNRTCVGRWRAGRHEACPGATPVASDFACLPCSGLEVPECVFEPQCASNPASCRCSFGPVPHVVYAAFYGPLPKVGMTQAWRLGTRLREQGADAYFVAAQVPDRATARNVERSIAFLYGIPEFRMPRELLPQMARPVAWDVVAARAETLRERLAQRFPSPGPTVRIMDHPVVQPLPSVPHRVQPFGRHEGTWLGAKGQNLFYLERGRLAVGGRPVAALKLRDLMGQTITMDDGASQA